MARLKKRADGRYAKWITLNNGIKRCVYGKSEAEVNKKAKSILLDDDRGIEISNNTTVAEWAQKWVSEYNINLRPTTQATYCNMLNKHILPKIGTIYLKSVRPVDIKKIMNSISDKSESLQKNVYRTVHRLFATAIQNRLIYLNPCQGVSITHRTDIDDNTGKLRALSNVQREKLLCAVIGSRQELFVNIGIWCGLRKEETLGLQWADIDFNNARQHSNYFRQNKK